MGLLCKCITNLMKELMIQSYTKLDTINFNINPMTESIIQLYCMYLQPRMFYWYISLENSFVSCDYGTNVGRGFVLDWLDCENLLQLTQKWVQLSTILLKKINIWHRLKVNTSFGSSVWFYQLTDNINNLMNIAHTKWQNQFSWCKYKQLHVFIVISWDMKFGNIEKKKNT